MEVDPTTVLISVSSGLTAFSAFTCCLVPSAYFLAYIYSRELTKRVSFQLTVLLSVIEIFYSLAQVFSNYYSTPGFLCSFGVFLFVFFCQWSILVSMFIAINLQLVFVYNKRKNNMLIKYIMGSFFIALALSLPPLFLGAYGYDETADFCWYTRSYDVVFAGLFISPFKWATNYLPSIIFIAYSTFASVRVMLRLRRAQLDSINVNQDSKNSSQRQNAKTQKIVAKLVSRLMFYPLVPLISNFFNIYGEADYAISHTNKFSLLVPALTGTSIQGLLTSILFFTIDPAWTKLYIDIRKYYDPHFEEAKSSSASNTGSGFESMGKAVSSVGQNQYHNTYHHFEGPKVISEIRTPATKEGVARFV